MTEDRSSRAARQTTRFSREARSLGLNIRALRSEQDLTLEEAADRMGLAPKHLQKIESGLINVTLVTLLRIADGLGSTVRGLFPLRPGSRR